MAIPKYQHSQSKHAPVVVGRQGLEGPGWIHHAGRRRDHGAYLRSPTAASAATTTSSASCNFNLTEKTRGSPLFQSTRDRRCMTLGYDSGLAESSISSDQVTRGPFLPTQLKNDPASWSKSFLTRPSSGAGCCIIPSSTAHRSHGGLDGAHVTTFGLERQPKVHQSTPIVLGSETRQGFLCSCKLYVSA